MSPGIYQKNHIRAKLEDIYDPWHTGHRTNQARGRWHPGLLPGPHGLGTASLTGRGGAYRRPTGAGTGTVAGRGTAGHSGQVRRRRTAPGNPRQVQGLGRPVPGLRPQRIERSTAGALGPQSQDAGGLAEQPQGGHGQHHRRLRRRVGGHRRGLGPVDRRQPGNPDRAPLFPRGYAQQSL